MKICHEWNEIDYFEAVCPHCRVIDTYFGIPPAIGEIVTCKNLKCKKKFKLGESE